MPQCENFDFKDTSFSELKNIIKSHNAPNAIIVLSGGEPLLHQKNTDFKDFLRFLIEQNRQVHFESNGTIEPDFNTLPELKNCYFALSVKLENSGESKEKRINARALKSIFANSKGALSRNCLAYKVSKAKVLLPLRPVNTTKLFFGISRLIFFRLCSLAPLILIMLFICNP